MNHDTEAAIVRAAAALVKPGADPILEQLELVQDLAESAAAYLESETSAPLYIEVSAVRGLNSPDGIETCNEALQGAEAFGVYLHNPTAFHLRDFETIPVGDEAWAEMQSGFALLERASRRALEWADALGEHIGCEVEVRFPRGLIRYAIEPQRDFNADDLADTGTAFGLCAEAEATQWALFAYRPGVEKGDADLVEDYPSRAAAEAAQRALEAGQPLPPIGFADEADIVAQLQERGYVIEQTGGGCEALVLRWGDRASVMVTSTDGAGLPDPDEWLVGVYHGEKPDSVMDVCVGTPGYTLEATLATAETIATALAVLPKMEG